MRILFVASEGLPFSKTGGLADVIEALPKALVGLGHEVAVVLPCYRGTPTSAVVLPSVTIPMGGTRLRFPSVAEAPAASGIRYFFVDDPAYFDRDHLYGGPTGDYPDNAERYGEFCKVAIEIAKQVWPPDVIHCHDWQSALVPVLSRTTYGDDRAGIPVGVFHPAGIEFFGNVNFLKGGLVFSDYLTTVSRKYAQEIQTREFGYGLDGVVRGRADRLVGILNGVDYGSWSPERDKFIAAKYSARDLSGKQACKQALLELFGLPPEQLTKPVIGIISRFADQKGFDLLAERASELMHEDLLLVVLGTGERKYEELFRALAAAHAGRVGVKIAYDNAIAHKIEAGADMFLMPSRYEPCGLNQIYSLKYGTVPIVRATGGLDDTIESYDVEHGTGTGFKFAEYTGAAMLRSVRQAVHLFADQRIWRRIQLNGMAKDYSWKASAGEYAKVYAAARAARGLPPLQEPVRPAREGAPGARNQKPAATSN